MIMQRLEDRSSDLTVFVCCCSPPPILEAIVLKFIYYFFPPLKRSVFIRCLKREEAKLNETKCT